MPRSIGVIYDLRSDGTLWKFDEDFGSPIAWSVVTTNGRPVTVREGAVGWRRGS